MELLVDAGGPSYPLELVERSKGRLARGTVYVTLDRMEQKGYIQSEEETPSAGYGGHPRRHYKVTGVGQRVFEAWQMVRNRLAVAPV